MVENFGGLKGADAHCQLLASRVGAGNKTWHAYLSTQERPGQPAINARDRIGTGPWYNAHGEMIAQGLAHLHGDTPELARLGNNITKLTNLSRKKGRSSMVLVISPIRRTALSNTSRRHLTAIVMKWLPARSRTAAPIRAPTSIALAATTPATRAIRAVRT